MQVKKPYAAPNLVIHGSVKKITQQVKNGNGGNNKPFNCGDGNSGTAGNNSCNQGGGGNGGGGGSVS